MLETGELPPLRMLGREAAQIFADLDSEHGVDLRCGVQVAEITGDGGWANGVLLADGDRIEADAVIVGIGISQHRACRSGRLEIDNGVRVDAHLRSSHPDIYAAGDVANASHPLLGKHIRVEHWANALNGPRSPPRPCWARMCSTTACPNTGYVEPGGYDQVVFRGRTDTREFIAFWLTEDRVLAGCTSMSGTSPTRSAPW